MTNRYVVLAGIMAGLLLLSAFTVPLVAPLRSSSAHLAIAVAIVFVGIALAAAVLFRRERAPVDLDEA